MAFNFRRKIQDFKELQRNLPVIIGNMAKNHYTKSFRDQGFTDNGLDPWAQRKSKDKSDRRSPARPRAILVKTGHLRGSIRVRVATFNAIEIGAYGVPYAVFHNRGTNKLPKRQFIGKSVKLERSIRARIRQEMKKVL